jgi:hypothetical protein
MKIFNPTIIIVFAVLLSSCFKEDEKIAPHDPGNVETVAIEMTHDYRYQVYYEMKSGEVVATNLKTDWDLGFECSKEGWHIILNTSDFMYAAATGLADLNIPADTTGLTWKFDVSTGNIDSTAIGKWVDFLYPDSVKIYSEKVYMINRGYDEAGNLRGMRKIVFRELSDSTYSFRYANLDGTGENAFTIKKDPAVNYTCFSFDDGGKQLDPEPPKYDWDLLFTQYTTLLFTDAGDPYPYLVTGVLTNPAGAQVAKDTMNDFSSINVEIAGRLFYTTKQDEIGYDWKDIVGDVSSGNVSYVIVPGVNYIVRDWQGFYYKLRFISFYNNSGEKGYPTFEYQRL